MIGNFIIRVGSTQPWLDVQLTQDGFVDLNLTAPAPLGCAPGCGDKDNIIDLTNAQVRFELYKCGREPARVAIQGTAEIVGDPTCGMVRYKWAAGDLLEACLYYGVFVITFPDASVLLWPYSREQLTIEAM